jgi:hypothetical protein
MRIDPTRMLENLNALAAAGVEPAASPEEHLDGADELIDRALAAHRALCGNEEASP